LGEILLEVKNLATYFAIPDGVVRSVDGISFSIEKGKTLGLVGESGSGKTVTALSIMGLIYDEPGIVDGRIYFQENGEQVNLLEGLTKYTEVERHDGQISQVKKDCLKWNKHYERNMRGIRGRKIGMIFQDAQAALNPLWTVGAQIQESMTLQGLCSSREEARAKSINWLKRVHIKKPERVHGAYPYQLSGGMCQRVMIAMALASHPLLLIADEPTTGLDVTIQAGIVELLKELRVELGTTILFISHNLGVVAELTDEVEVVYNGRMIG